LDSKSKQCIMVGYFDEIEVVRCYHPLAHKILISKGVKFDEQNFWHPPIDSSSKPLVSFLKNLITLWLFRSLTHPQLLHHIVYLI
jgi:hypothetical protein